MRWKAVVGALLLVTGVSQLVAENFSAGVLLIVGALVLFVISAEKTVKRQQKPVETPTPKSPPAAKLVPLEPPAAVPQPLEPPTEVQPPPPAPETTTTPPTRQVSGPGTIVTRTTQGGGPRLIDPYAEHEREWTCAEDLELLEEYQQTNKMAHIAEMMVVDQRQVAIRLVRLLLNPIGPIDDVESASRNGKHYEKGERAGMVTAYAKRESLQQIALTTKRTQLGVGWQLLEHQTRPVKVPHSLLSELRQRSGAMPSAPE